MAGDHTTAGAEPLDVAIVGGGVSGIYAAWRLLSASVAGPWVGTPTARRVGVYEGSARIGGRLLSLAPPDISSLRAELGGMRFMSSQPLVSGLVAHLGLATDELPADEPGNLVYLRGTHLRDSDLDQPGKVPYDLDSFEQGASPGALTGRALEQLIPRIGSMSIEELTEVLETRTIDGAHLWEWGFWNLLALALSTEGFRFAQKGMGYDTALYNWNAADTIIMNADFAPGTTYHRIRDGFETVPTTLAAEVMAKGGTIASDHRLLRFDVATLTDGTPGVVMVFDTDPDPGNVTEVTVEARSLILAMPRRSIELLDQTGAVLGPDQTDVHALISSVTPNPLFKAALCYREPWWEATGPGGPLSGRAVTDLPIRQCYYWGVERDQAGGAPSDAAMLLIYDDGENVDFWAGFRTEEARRALGLVGPDGVAVWSEHEAPPAMVAELHRQVVELHGMRTAPPPYAAAFVDWGVDPYGGGVNFWNPGVKSWEVIPKVARPRPDLPVFIVGEAYSKAQGWVEGALETAELVLQGSYFGLGPPPFPGGPPAPGPSPSAARR